MATTALTAIGAAGWTAVSAAAEAGFITNEGRCALMYRQQAADPGAGVVEGHTLPAGAGQSVNFDLSGTDRAWLRAAGAGGRAAVSI